MQIMRNVITQHCVRSGNCFARLFCHYTPASMFRVRDVKYKQIITHLTFIFIFCVYYHRTGLQVPPSESLDVWRMSSSPGDATPAHGWSHWGLFKSFSMDWMYYVSRSHFSPHFESCDFTCLWSAVIPNVPEKWSNIQEAVNIISR